MQSFYTLVVHGTSYNDCTFRPIAAFAQLVLQNANIFDAMVNSYSSGEPMTIYSIAKKFQNCLRFIVGRTSTKCYKPTVTINRSMYNQFPFD